ncbi:MAG: SDR family oxidoreductase [Chlorobiaceae bacterium]|nr:SDR family oxidoreductase [Chlorobiaceae bacterium]NTW74616.1 SDR family oxidoreductase [Chlorobiaceae bacterium]
MSGIPILITGATGYIGAQLVLALLRNFGDAVHCRVTVRSGSDTGFLKNLPVQIVNADIHDAIAVAEAVRGSEVVFHCAGLIAYTANFRNRLYETNVLGTRNVVNACIACGVRRLVATSSIAAIGVAEPGQGEPESTESSEFSEWQRRNVYMESKHLAELECRRGAAEGLDVVMVNPGVVIGKGEGADVPGSSSNEVLQRIYRGSLPFCPNGGTGFVDVRDVADAHIAAWQQGLAGERYIIVGENLTFRELFGRIAALPGSRAKTPLRVSGPFASATGLGGEIWSLLSGRPSFISIESIRQASRPAVYSNRRSVHELGMSYRPLEETLKSTIS